MTIDLDKLEQLARAASITGRVPGGMLAPGVRDHAWDEFRTAAFPAAVLELVERLRAAESAVVIDAARLINDLAFMSKLVDEHEKKYGDARNVERAAIVREFAALPDWDYEPAQVRELVRRAVESTKRNP